MQANAALTGDNDLVSNDLGPLAWVLDELRKSLDGATKALRRFVRDAELARGSDLADLDASQLRIARQQLHQAVGALEMVGMAAPAKVLRAMEALAQRFVQRPELCSDDAANKVERASFALAEYLEGVLKGKDASPVALFPQYRDVLELVGEDRVHPADLWPLELRWLDVALARQSAPITYDSAVRAQVDGWVLKVVKTSDVDAAQAMHDVSLGFAAAQSALEARVFWKISAAYFQAVALGLCPADIYGKRAASRILLQYRTLAKGDPGISERLVQDLLFFCAQAVPPTAVNAPELAAVRQAYGLSQIQAVDYETPQFGRFDPALLVQARKRIAAATETWSALAGGDTNKLKLASDQFSQVTDSVLKLHPECGDLARALTRAIETTTRSGEAPTPALAMEVATAVLYLEAAYEDLDPTDSQMALRSVSLARRLEHVNAGGQTEPLEGWMEELYRRVSDRQIMGSVVDELRTALGEVEKSLDAFFRNPLDKVPLHEVPSRLAQMRGVFSVLGLDQAALACLRMRNSVEQFLMDEIDVESARTGVFEKLGNSLGAMGFLIDMLSYQRALAKKLFVYDEELGEFKPLMGREKAPERPVVAPPEPLAVVAPLAVEEPVATVVSLQHVPVATPVAVAASVMAMAAATPAVVKAVVAEPPDDDEMELKDIFLEEAREVVQTGLAATQDLRADPADLAQQTTLRRAFHTLKGSARMVGLLEFGEAAWAMEQLLNSWLAEQKPASADLIGLSDQAMQGFGRWVEDIARGEDAPWAAQAFRVAADSLRVDSKLLALVLPGDEVPAAPVAAPVSAEAETSEPIDLDFSELVEPPESAPEVVEVEVEVEEEEDTQPAALSAMAPVASELEPETQATSLAVPELDDQVKVIDSLRIDIPLYNVYLNEADEWSRHLLTELSEWALELHRPLADSTVGWAHSLSGSSATVGFLALSGLARALEQAMRHVRLHAQAAPEYAEVFVAAAEDVRRLLHQFAAGFLKEPDPKLLDALKAIQELQFPAPAAGDEDSLYLEQELDTVAPSEANLEPAPLSEAAAAPIEPAEDEITVLDVLDVDLFPIFEEEALELLPQLGGALRQWTARPENLGARGEVLRVLHTLKGSARLAGAMRLGELTHRMESRILELGPVDLQPSQQESLLTRFDALQANFDQLRALPAQALSLPEAGPVALAVEEAAQPVSPAAEVVPAMAVPAAQAAVAPIVIAPIAAPLAPVRPVSTQTVRVRAQLLDRLVNQAGEVMITRSRMEARLGQLRGSLGELAGNLDRLRVQLRDIELQSESQMQSRLAQTKESAQGFDPLEFDRFTRVQELTRMMAESVHDVATVQRNLQRTVEGTEDDLIAQARQARELQRDLLRTRMVEFDGISGRLHGVVRQAAKDTGKQVNLQINGGALDMDRGVLERMATVFEHVLRNAVAHGIEDPAQRSTAGKPAAGTVTVNLQQQGNDVTVEFVDDGAGLDLDRIRAKARASGQIAADASLTDAEAANLIFSPGLSTASQVTELAGRGIGLDVVRSEVNALGGRIETSTQRGRGTTFRLVLPLTTAVTQVVMLRMGELVIGVPANLVEMVRRVPAAELERAYQNNVFEFNGEPVPFFWAGALFHASTESGEARTKTCAVAIFRSAGQRVATHVDEVLGNQEVVVKNLGPQLSGLPGLTGMSVLASGAVVLIYNPVALVAVYGEQARQFKPGADQARAGSAAATAGPSALLSRVSQAPLVLVVDDSITVRRVTQRLLKREGFRVALAADGLQALERLQEERPAVVLSDIEMPRMDGFDLARNIRGDAQLRDLPIIMITSRIAEKHRDYARELGVDHYLGKPYSEDELIGLVRHYCAMQLEVVED
jgi:chemosensory pili system protein ChpA (sensor histidine kinase/response regulator)